MKIALDDGPITQAIYSLWRDNEVANLFTDKQLAWFDDVTDRTEIFEEGILNEANRVFSESEIERQVKNSD